MEIFKEPEAVSEVTVNNCEFNTKLSCCKEAARCSVSWTILLSLKVTQDHSNLHRCVGRKFLLVFHCNNVYFVPFLRYSISNNGMPLKSAWHHSIDHMRFTIDIL